MMRRFFSRRRPRPRICSGCGRQERRWFKAGLERSNFVSSQLDVCLACLSRVLKEEKKR